MQQLWRLNMPAAVKHESPRTQGKDPSFVSLLSGWAQQGAQTLFATQRILIDLAMKQNASIMHAVKQQLTDPHHSPTAILSEAAGEGINNFIEAQKVLLDLGKEQNEIVMNGVKERVGDCPIRRASVDLLRRSVDTFVELQQEYLKIASKQSHAWLDAAKSGKPYQPEHVMELARESVESFVKAEKRFLDVIDEEAGKALNGKPVPASAKRMKQTEVQELARRAAGSFMEAQKRLLDLAGKQMNANVKTATKAAELVRPFPFLPLSELTREAVKSYVDAQKALMDVMVHPPSAKPVRSARRAVKKEKMAAAAAVA
jgi:hypothetical protein